MRCRILLFDTQKICSLVFCRGIEDEAPAQLPAAPFTVVLVSSGHAAVSWAGGESALLGAGGLLLAADTALMLTPATECHILAAAFGGEAARAAGDTLTQPLVSDCAVCPMTAQLLGELAQASEASVPALCFEVLCSLAQADSAAPRLSPLVAGAVLAIRQNYAGLYGVEELSTQLGVSKSHLVRVFSAEIGMGPGQYLTNVRLDAAKALLAQRSYPLSVVATLCGFSSANYLCRVFKKHTGLSPAAWRARSAGQATAEYVSEWERALYT